jgi:hypothetical protein
MQKLYKPRRNFRVDFLVVNQSRAAIGNDARGILKSASVGALVEIVSATVEFPFPAAT